jgi:hypothetical protein
MRIRLRYVLAAGGVAAVIGAPAAMADDTDQNCADVGGGTECSSPGNVQINDSPPVVGDNGFGNGWYGGPYMVPFGEGSR